MDKYGDRKGYSYSPKTIAKFKLARMALLCAEIYAQRIDWLVSGDDGEDSFHSRLDADFDALDRRLGGSEGSDEL